MNDASEILYDGSMNDARRLDLDGLRAFLAIAREATVHAAANRVARSPAAVSMQLKKLEDTLGEVVFARSKTGMRLTPAGDRLLPFAQRIVDLEGAARRAFSDEATGGPVRVGFVEGVGDKRFPQIFDAFAKACPSATLTMQLSTSAKLAAAVDAGDLDLAVFATGGIGGVHKGAEGTFDISADLMELGQTPVTVVAAGAKAILDIPKTLEVLETQGVPVIAYGQNDMPAFWSRSAGLRAPLRMDDARTIAAAHAQRAAMGIPGGQLIANPIPPEAEIDRATLAPIIAQATGDANRHGITGKGVTPYLLQRIYELTEGRSLTANIALVRNNARLAAEIATELSAITGNAR